MVEISDISIYATRTVTQNSYAHLDDILDNGQGIEEFFEEHDEWENHETENFEYEIEVAGVVSRSYHEECKEKSQSVIDRQREQIKELSKNASDMADTIAKLKSHMHKNNVKGLKKLLSQPPSPYHMGNLLKGEEE